MAKELGLRFTVVPRIEAKADAIEAARAFLNMTWIDEQHCARGIQCLENYRKEWNERLSTWRDKPLHDWASHGADALMTGVLGFDPATAAPLPRSSPPYPAGARLTVGGVIECHTNEERGRSAPQAVTERFICFSRMSPATDCVRQCWAFVVRTRPIFAELR